VYAHLNLKNQKTGAPPERGVTDTSLRAERAGADAAMVEKRRDLDEDADQVVERARERADAVLKTARDNADRVSSAAAGEALAHARIIAGRLLADKVVGRERATADERLRLERRDRARALAFLLPMERRRTDANLLTERARSDEQIAHRDDFLGIASHDLRNLLCALLMEASDLSDKASDSEEGRRTVASVRRLLRYAARMNGLIGDLVDVVSIDAGRLPIERERLDATAVLSEIIELFRPVAEQSGLSLDLEDGGQPLPADYDSGRMLQVLGNLVTNAIKFTPSGGCIRLWGQRMEDGLRVCVRDTGVGISKDMSESIFERFWQVGKQDRRGLGLGLYISRCLVEAHGGKIWAESTPGEGTAFFFTIPDQAVQAGSTEDPRVREQATG
jgi:signal transduction histidine kinase